jgi:hypothetical protein
MCFVYSSSGKQRIISGSSETLSYNPLPETNIKVEDNTQVFNINNTGELNILCYSTNKLKEYTQAQNKKSGSNQVIIRKNTISENQIISINNSLLELGFEKKTGSLLFLDDLINKYEFLDPNIKFSSFWEVQLIHSSGTETINMNTLSEFHFSKPGPLSLLLTWDNFQGAEYKDLNINVTVTLDENKALSYWDISVEGVKGIKVKKVVFPKIGGLKDMGEEYLSVPYWMGKLYKNPRNFLAKEKSKKIGLAYPGRLSLQCWALYNPDKCGFYVSCNDSLAYKKDFSFTLDTLNSLTYQMDNYPAFDSTLNFYDPPYQAVIGSFKGDWITTAELYREWGSRQRWCSESRLKNGLIPSWLEETALWVWNRGKSDNVLLPAADLRQRLNLPVSVFWHWWHGCPYDTGYPEYFPPREGKKSFISAMSIAKAQDIHAIVYMACAAWMMTTESWEKENASKYTVKEINGSITSHSVNSFYPSQVARMCMATQFWRDKYASLCDSAVNTYQTNGVYMDVACNNPMCYDKSHDHTVGGGNYWVQNFGRLMEQIHSKVTHNNDPIMAGEGACEAWLPFLDAFLTLEVSNERWWGNASADFEPIPLFQAVYHQYGITYGSYSSLLVPPYDELWPKEYAPENPNKLLNKDFNKQFLMEQARAFVWGMQPTIANYQSFLPLERKEEINYLINLAKVRYQGLKYLLHGKFHRSPEIKFPEEKLNVSILSIYSVRDEGSVTSFKKTCPLIYSGTWKSDDNQLGIALASISDDPFRVNFSFNSNDYNLPSSGNIYIIDIDGKRKLTGYSNSKIKIDFVLPSKGLCIVEIIPGTD